MKLKFGNGTVEVIKIEKTDVAYCYLLSRRNMSAYSKQTKTLRQYSDELKASETYILRYKGKRFGFFEYEIKSDGLYVWNIQLSKILQGKGLGTSILNIIEKKAAEKKIKKLVLFLFAKNPAMNLYKRHGFKITKEYSETSRVCMEKML